LGSLPTCQGWKEGTDLLFCPCQEALSFRFQVAHLLQGAHCYRRRCPLCPETAGAGREGMRNKRFCHAECSVPEATRAGKGRSRLKKQKTNKQKTNKQTKNRGDDEQSQQRCILTIPSRQLPFIMLISCGKTVPRNCLHSTLQKQTHTSQPC